MSMSFTHFSSGHIQPTNSTDDSKVGFRLCYKHTNLIFIMKNIVTVDTVSEVYSVIHRYEKTRCIISTNLAPKRNNKNMFIFLTVFLSS